MPGLTKAQITELCPDIKHGLDHEGPWNESTKEVETPQQFEDRIKGLIREFKELHKKHPESTFVVISHGHVLRKILSLLTNQPKTCKDYQSKNNSLTIVDFVSSKNEVANLEYIDVRLLAYNLQILDNVETNI